MNIDIFYNYEENENIFNTSEIIQGIFNTFSRNKESYHYKYQARNMI